MSERDGEGTEKKELFGCADVVKWFGRKLVLDGARFLVPYGGVAGIFGLNGSGKTTLLRILAGLDRDFEGELSKTDFEDVAYMATEGGFPFGMSVRDAVNFYAAFLPRLDADAIFRDAREAGIRPRQSVIGMSSGMKQYLKFLLTAYSGARGCACSTSRCPIWT